MEIIFLLLCQTVVFVGGGQVFNSATERRNRKRKDKNTSNDDRGLLKSKEKWVVDSIFYEDYQSDAPAVHLQDSQDACPPVPDVVTAGACAQSSCQKDTDCADSFRCCFTGCSFTCLPEVKPAAVVDWRKEPRRSRSGISWLINETKDPVSKVNSAESCSTSPVESDEDPLLCPDGYYCHITEKGNPKHGISNSGYCVKTTDDQYSPGEEELVIKSALKQRTHCLVDNYVLLEGASIKLENRNCRCKKGYLSCRERSKQRTHRRRKIKRINKSKKNKDTEVNVTS